MADKHASLDTPRVLICCKADTPECQREIQSEVAREYATMLGMEFAECSALTGEGCTEVFERVIRTALNSRERAIEKVNK